MSSLILGVFARVTVTARHTQIIRDGDDVSRQHGRRPGGAVGVGQLAPIFGDRAGAAGRHHFGQGDRDASKLSFSSRNAGGRLYADVAKISKFL